MSQFTPSYLPLIGLDPVNAGVVAIPQPTGIAGTDTLNINTAISGLPTTGGTLVFQPGIYVTTGNHAITVPVRIVGAGFGALTAQASGAIDNSAITWIQCTSSNVNAFNISANNCQFKDFRLSCTSANPITGTGIQPGASSIGIHTVANGNLSGSNFLYDQISIDGFSIGLQHDAGHYWQLHRSLFFNCWTNDLIIDQTINKDEGALIIKDCVFLPGTSFQSPITGIIYRGGGGMIFQGNRFNLGPLATNGLLNYGDFVNNMTIIPFNSTEIIITDNSFGAYSANGLLIDFTGLTNKALGKLVFSQNLGLSFGQQVGPAISANVFLLNIKSSSGTNLVSQLLYSNNVVSQPSALGHFDSTQQLIIGDNSITQNSPGTPAIEIGQFTSNVIRSGKLSASDTGITNYGATAFGSGTGAYRQAPQLSFLDNGSAAFATNQSIDEFTCRFQNVTAGLTSVAITAAAINAIDTNILAVTVTAHQFALGDQVYVAGVVATGNMATNLNNATAGNSILHIIVGVPDANTVQINAVNQTAWTGAYTSGGYMTHAGQMFEVMATPGAAYNLELDINIGNGSGTLPLSAKLIRNVWIQQGAAAQSSMAVLQTYGTDTAMIDPTVNVSAGSSPLIANAQPSGGGAVTTANSVVNNPVFSVTAAGVGNGFEVAFQSTKVVTLGGSYGCAQGAQAQSGLNPFPSFSVSSVSRVGGAATTIYRLTVAGGNNVQMKPGQQFQLSGATAGFASGGTQGTGINGTWQVFSWNNNQSWDFDVGADLGAGPATGTIIYNRDRFVVCRQDVVNNGNLLQQAYIGQSIASLSIAGQTVSSITASGLVATVTTSVAHTLSVNASITVSGVAGGLAAALNITAVVTSIPSSTVFTYALTISSSGTATGAPAYSVTTGTRRIAQIISNNAFIVDQPYLVDFNTQTLITTPSTGINKLTCYVRPINATGQLFGSVTVKAKGWYRFLNKMCT